MSVTVEDIAAAIVDALADVANAAAFPETFDVEWDYVRMKKYTEYTTSPEILVIPRIESNEQENREENRFQMDCGIVAIRKVTTANKTTVQPLLDLPRAIRDFLLGRNMAGCEWENTTIDVLYGHDELKNDATLVTVLSARYWIDQ
jgi:hypothetical protein